MRIHRVLPIALTLSLGALFACNSSSSSGDTTTTATSASASATPQTTPAPVASEKKEAHKPRIHGPSAMLFRAASELADLKDTQKTTIEKITTDLKDEAGPKPEFKDMQSELITEVKAGKIDAAKLGTKTDAIDKAMQANLDKEAAGLTQLHDALEPAQRKAATAAVRAKQTDMEAKMAKMREGMGQKADGPPKPEEMMKRHTDRLTKDLDLDATQQKTLDGIVTKIATKPNNPSDMRAEWKKNTDAMLVEFEKDTFDAKKLPVFSEAAKKGHGAFSHEVDLLTQLVPVLKPEQRDKLAAKLEHPMMGHGPEGHGPGMGGPERTGFEKNWQGPFGADDDMGPGMGGSGAPPGAPGPQAPAPTAAPQAPAPQTK